MLDKQRAAVGQGGQVENVDFSISPDYRYPERNKRTLEGYVARASLAVTTEDLGSVARLVDVATAGGAGDIRVSYLSKNVTASRREAIGEAARIARGYAEALAAAQGVKLGRVLELEEQTPSGWTQPSGMNGIAMPGPGETMAVRVSVTATYAVE